MAAPVIQTNLTLITEAESITNWNALGGGAAGLVAETDFFIQNATCVSKQCSAALKGMIFNFGSTITPGANTHFLTWIYCTTPSGLAELTGGGMRATIGTATTAYVDFYVDGKTPYIYGGWKCYPVRYLNTTGTTPPQQRFLVGAPGANPQYFGAQVNCLATVKASNLGVDVIRHGDGIYITQGESGANGAASLFTASAYNDLQNNRWGILQSQPGGYLWQGKLMIGQTTASVVTPTYFTASNATVIIADTPHALSTFTEMIVDSTGTTFNLSNITFLALGTTNPGRLYYLARPTASLLDSVTFANFGKTTLTSSVTASACTWRNTDVVAQVSAGIDKCTFDRLSSTSSLLSNNPTAVTNCTFISDGSNHAIEINAPGSCSFVGHKFTGYAATSGTSGNEMVYNTSGGAVTISVISGDVPTFRNSGSSSTTVISGQRSFVLTGLQAGTEVRIYNSTTDAAIAGTETSTSTFTYNYTYTADVPIYVVIFHLSYLPIRLVGLTLGDANQSIPIQQQTDRVYYNPP
jgi:hypothetical protein